MSTPAQNLAWLKKNHPGMTLAQWHAQTAAAFKLKHPTTPARQGIPSTIADVQAVRNSLWHPKQAYADALAEATAAGNAQLEGLPDQTKLQSDANQMADVIKGFGDNLFAQLGNVQTANADQANGGISLYKKDAAAADQAANAQIIAAGGTPTGAVSSDPAGTISTSGAPGAAVSLSNLAANANNVFGARAYAAGQQELLDQRQNQNDLKKSIYDLNQNKDKVQKQAGADALSLFRNERQNVENQIPSYLNYSLYNTRETNDAKQTNRRLDQGDKALTESKRYHQALEGIANDKAKATKAAKDGKITAQQAAFRIKQANGYVKFLNNSPAGIAAGATTGGKGKYTMEVSYMAKPVTNAATGQTTPGGWKTKTLTFSAGQFQQWQNSIKQNGTNHGDLTLINGQPGDTRIIRDANGKPTGKLYQYVAPAASTTAASTPWSPAAAWAYIIQLYTDPAKRLAKYRAGGYTDK